MGYRLIGIDHSSLRYQSKRPDDAPLRRRLRVGRRERAWPYRTVKVESKCRQKRWFSYEISEAANSKFTASRDGSHKITVGAQDFDNFPRDKPISAWTATGSCPTW